MTFGISAGFCKWGQNWLSKTPIKPSVTVNPEERPHINLERCFYHLCNIYLFLQPAFNRRTEYYSKTIWTSHPTPWQQRLWSLLTPPRVINYQVLACSNISLLNSWPGLQHLLYTVDQHCTVDIRNRILPLLCRTAKPTSGARWAFQGVGHHRKQTILGRPLHSTCSIIC